METPTLGQQRIRVAFNPSENSLVDAIKAKSAELIDLVQAYKNTVVSETYDTQTPTQLQQDKGEFFRLISLAQTAYEEGAMWGVKALTYFKP